MERMKELEIKYGELDIYYPLKFESSLSFDEDLKTIAERMSNFVSESLEKGLDEKQVSLLKKEMENFEKRSAFISEEFKESVELYGTVYTNAQERFLILPLRVELYNKRCVWLQAILYIFRNDMCILKLELPLEDVSNEPLKKCEWDKYIHNATCVWNVQATELSTFEEIKKMYISVINEAFGIGVSEYNGYLYHIILVDFKGCPYNVNDISDDVQEELFRTIAAPIVEAPYTTYRDEAKAYIRNNSWGTHNIRCILKSTGGCLSILERKVQEYWIKIYSQEKGGELNHDEYLDMYTQYVNKIQNSTEFPLIILLLKRINILNDISVKNATEYKEKRSNKNRKSKYEYLENNIFISTIQEECCGTVSEQVAEFERMMPHYTKKEITSLKHESLNEIICEKKAEKEERYQKFISEISLILSVIFGLPAIQEAISILREACVWIEGDIPYISQNNLSVVIWIVLNIVIYGRMKKFQV